MKKFTLTFLTVFALVLTTSCSKDDDGDGGSAGVSELKVTINGVAKTFNAIVINTNTYEESGVTFTEKSVTATVGGDTSEIMYFELDQGDTGADAIYYFTYTVNGEQYDIWNGSGFSSVVSVNDGTTISATFSGEMGKWNNDTQMMDIITFSNGSVTAVE